MSSFSIHVDSEFESIYNLVPKVQKKVERPPMYKSRHNPLAPIAFSTNKGGAPNLGKMKNHADPVNFLRKSTPSKRNPLKPIENKFNYPASKPLKAKVPSKDDRPVVGLFTEKNFVTANAIEAILAVPRIPDSAAPDYLRKEDFGKVPKYLGEVQKEISQENEMIDAFVRKQMEAYEDTPELCDAMPDEERVVLIEKLKTKWDAVNKKYQVLCMHTMFEGHQKAKKEHFEKEMNGIEEDLEKLTSNGPLMISRG
ncbi:hypothetical protein TrLO_g10182 [Triparma laevis f. longispina]|uniref:Enkurin domain-containing protein n=1 Tax=Triparma laevis f. longispina TaxID=1714387 RepID=A0A9W7CPQ3_9STRA|nr:hypothetical protein TrLO_g10182 [Triparma laevis f. longispina]